MEPSPDQRELLHKWTHAKAEYQRWAETETYLRDEIIKAFFNPDIDEGTETLTIFDNWTLKATKRLNYTLKNDEGQISAICAALPEQISRQLVRWKPELSLTAYRKLDLPTQQMFDGALSIKPGRPTLELFPQPVKDIQ